jgi:hypothetical protein
MSSIPQIDEMVEVAGRTLRAAGYEVIGFQRTFNRAEFRCVINTKLGAIVRFLFVFSSDSEFQPDDLTEFRHVADSQGLALIVVSGSGAENQVSWMDFLRAMGGAVPSWRALQPNYRDALLTASTNTVPPGESGEAWALFEDLIADGLEFAFGRKVRRFGGRRRGQKVSDMIAQLPESDLLIVDGKATASEFDAGWPQLRALAEYVEKQRARQNGLNEILAALIFSRAFQQDNARLRGASDEFFASARVPLCFMTANTLAFMIEAFRENLGLRNVIRWRSLFVGGLIEDAKLSKLIREAKQERIEPGEI